MPSQPRPRIGITMDVGTPDESRKTLELPADYPRQIFAAGGLPILLPPTHDPAAREELINLIDGLLVPGGDDLDPKLYGQPQHPQTHLADHDRQSFDLAMLALAEARQLPTLGICMGCQTMNIQRRGTLHQHLPDLHGSPISQSAAPTASQLPITNYQLQSPLSHRTPNDRTNAHDIHIRPNTHLASALQLNSLQANSRHHQGIDKIGHGLIPTATAPDGLVEALEDPSLPFWIAVQWHPENLANTPHERLFQALVSAARDYRATK